MPSATGAVLDAMESDDAAAAAHRARAAPGDDPLADFLETDAAPANAPSSNAHPVDEGLRNLVPEGQPVDKGKDVGGL